jgi:hypothetical protein
MLKHDNLQPSFFPKLLESGLSFYIWQKRNSFQNENHSSSAFARVNHKNQRLIFLQKLFVVYLVEIVNFAATMLLHPGF